MLNRIKGILYDIVLRFAVLGKRQKSGAKICIVRTDEIGDYMLWRKYLPAIADHYKSLNYEIHLIGNSSWKSLFNQFDQSYVNHVIWVDKIKFKKDLGYKYQLLRKTYQANYEIVINPIFSRDKRNDDAFVMAAKAKNNIGMVANTESVKPYELGYDKNLYNRLYQHQEQPIFELYRNKYFAEYIIGKQINISNTSIDQTTLPALSFNLPDKYIVVFPGSRSATRIWPVNAFIQVCNELFSNYQYTVVLCGSNNDKKYTNEFESKYKHPLLNLTSKTTLPELLTVFSKSALLLSVDTGSIHLAAAVKCPIAGIFNGSQYKRFAPYPSNIHDHFIAVYPDEIENDLLDDTIVKANYEFAINIPYNLVSPEKLIKKIKNSNIVL